MTATREHDDIGVADDAAPQGRRRWAWTAPVLIVLVGLAAVEVWWQVLGQRSQEQRVEQARTAAEAIVADLLTYRHNSVAEELDAALLNVAGEFAEDYHRLVDETIAPVSRERRLDTEVAVLQSGIVAAEEDSVTVLFFVDQAITSVDAPGTRRDISRIEVTVRQTDDVWKVDRLEAV